MGNNALTKPRFSVLQIIAILGALLYYLIDKLHILTKLTDFQEILIYMGILLFCTAVGVKFGIKNLVKSALEIIEDESLTPELAIKKLLKPFMLLGDKIGYEFDRLNDKQGTNPKTKGLFFGKKKEEEPKKLEEVKK